MTSLGNTAKCNCDDDNETFCPIHGSVKRYLDKNRKPPERPLVMETVPVDEIHNGQVGERRVKLIAHTTLAEQEMIKILERLKLDYAYNWYIYPYYVDFLIWDYGLVLEIDGSAHAKRDYYDDRRSKHITKLGLELYRLYNRDVTEDNVVKLLEKCPINSKQTVKNAIDTHNRKYVKKVTPLTGDTL